MKDTANDEIFNLQVSCGKFYGWQEHDAYQREINRFYTKLFSVDTQQANLVIRFLGELISTKRFKIVAFSLNVYCHYCY